MQIAAELPSNTQTGSASPVLRSSIKNLQVRYTQDALIRFPDFEINAGSELVLLGPSGSGKTTLLHCLAGLLKPSSGTVAVASQDLYVLTEANLERFRAQTIGLVFQDFHLIEGYTALENVMVALAAAGSSLKDAKQEAKATLSTLSLAHRLNSKPKQLSTGERQRVAIARAIAAKPVLLLADEPTANLDRARAQTALQLLREVAQKAGSALIIATHDPLVISTFPDYIDLSASLSEVNLFEVINTDPTLRLDSTKAHQCVFSIQEQAHD